MFTSGTIVNLGRSRVVLISDDIGTDVPPRGVQKPLRVQALGEGRFIWVSEDAVKRAREKNPSLPIYGLWQVLATNRKLTGDDTFYGYEISETQWAYAHVVRGRAESSGRAVGPEIVALGIRKTDVILVDPAFGDALTGCVPPPFAARLPAEIQAEQQGKDKRRKLIGFGAVAAAVAGLVAIDMVHSATHSARVAQRAALDAQIATLQEALTVAKTNISPLQDADRRRQIVLLDRLLQLTVYAELDKQEQEVTLWQASTVDLNVSGYIPAPTFPVELFVTEARRVGLRFSVEPEIEAEITPVTATLQSPSIQRTIGGTP